MESTQITRVLVFMAKSGEIGLGGSQKGIDDMRLHVTYRLNLPPDG